MSKGTPRSLKWGNHIYITIGEPMYPGVDDDPNTVTVELRSRLEELLADTIERYPDEPKDDNDRWWLPASYGGTAPTLAAAKKEDEAAAAKRRERRSA